MGRSAKATTFSFVLSLLIILMPAASAIPIWVINPSITVMEMTYAEHTKKVESEEGLFLGNQYIGSEYYEPHVVTIEGSEILIGNSYDHGAHSGGLWGTVSATNEGDSVYNKRTYIPKAKLYGKSWGGSSVVVDGSNCIKVLQDNDPDSDFVSHQSIETHHLLHASSLPKGGPERVGVDRIYGGYISAQIEGGAWVGCAVDSYDLSFMSEELRIEPSDSEAYNQECENKTVRQSERSINFIRVICDESFTAVHQNSYGYKDHDGKTLVDDIVSYPRTGVLGGCVATDGSIDYVLGGVNLRGEFYENLTMFNRSNGNAIPVNLPTPVSSVGASCFVSNNQIIILGGYETCPHYEMLHTHMQKSDGVLGFGEGTETVRDGVLAGEIRGPTFGGGCLAFISEGYQSQQSIKKHPYSDSDDKINPPYAFPESFTAFACASSYSVNLSSFEVKVLEHSNELLNCAAFSTDLILNSTTLLRFGGFNPQGYTLDGIQRIQLNLNSTVLNVSVVAEMTIPRISPVVEYVDGTISVMCGGAFEKKSGHQCNIIDQFTENTSSPIQVTYTEEESTPGFSFLVAVSGIFAAATVISSRREQDQHD